MVFSLLELELQAVVNPFMVLECGSSAREVSTLICSALICLFLKSIDSGD